MKKSFDSGKITVAILLMINVGIYMNMIEVFLINVNF